MSIPEKSLHHKCKLMNKRKEAGLKGRCGGQFRYEESFMRMVVREFETGDLSLRQVALKFGIRYQNIQYWKARFGNDIAVLTTQCDQPMTPEEQKEQAALKKQLAQLQKENEYLKMKELALETMIDIAKEEFNIDLRKKSGTKPSGE